MAIMQIEFRPSELISARQLQFQTNVTKVINHFVLLLASPVLVAAPITHTSPQLLQSLQIRADHHWNGASPTVKSWAAQQSRAIIIGTSDPYAMAKNAAAKSTWAVSDNLNGSDIEAIAYLVLMQASKFAQDDIKSIMDNVKSINSHKQHLRESLKKVQRDLALNTGKARNALCPLSASGLSAADIEIIQNHPPTKIRRTTYLRPALTVADLQLQESVLNDDIKSYDDMSQTESFRLQMLMDRKSKMIQTLSNIIKEISDTSMEITHNLK